MPDEKNSGKDKFGERVRKMFQDFDPVHIPAPDAPPPVPLEGKPMKKRDPIVFFGPLVPPKKSEMDRLVEALQKNPANHAKILIFDEEDPVTAKASRERIRKFMDDFNQGSFTFGVNVSPEDMQPVEPSAADLFNARVQQGAAVATAFRRGTATAVSAPRAASFRKTVLKA